jgi:hypothetical protein
VRFCASLPAFPPQERGNLRFRGSPSTCIVTEGNQLSGTAMGSIFPQLEGRLLVIYDGECGFCNQSIRWLLRRDRKDHLRFASSTAPAVQELLAAHGMPAVSPNSSTGDVTYADAGVDISSGDRAKERIKYLAKRTFNRSVLGGIGGFGALFQLDLKKWAEPVLVSSADGVGTKLKLAFDLGIHNTVGQTW